MDDLRRACPSLTLQQIYKLTEHHHDDWISDDQVEGTGLLLEALKSVVERQESSVSISLACSITHYHFHQTCFPCIFSTCSGFVIGHTFALHLRNTMRCDTVQCKSVKSMLLWWSEWIHTELELGIRMLASCVQHQLFDVLLFGWVWIERLILLSDCKWKPYHCPERLIQSPAIFGIPLIFLGRRRNPFAWPPGK